MPKRASDLGGEVHVRRLPRLLAVLCATPHTIATAAATTPTHRELLRLVPEPFPGLGRQVHLHRLRWLLAMLRATARSVPATTTIDYTDVHSAAAAAKLQRRCLRQLVPEPSSDLGC